MGKKFFLIIPVLILALVISGYLVLKKPSEEIYIAVVCPMSGKDKDVGQPVYEGAAYYFNKLNKSGGIDGRKVKLIVENDENDPGKATICAQRLVRNKKIVAIIGHRYSKPTLEATNKVYVNAGLPVISPTASNPEITAGKEWNFRMIFDDKIQAEFIVMYIKHFILQNNSSKNITILYVDNEKKIYGKSLKDCFLKAVNGTLTTTPIKVVNSREFNIDEKKLKILVQSDVIFLAMHLQDGLNIMERIHSEGLREKGLKAKFIGGDSIGNYKFIEKAKEKFGKQYKSYIEGLYAVNYFSEDILGLEARKFTMKFEKIYNKKLEWGGVMAYDAAHLLAEAIKKRGADRAGIRNFLGNINSQQKAIRGITGDLFFDKEGNCMRTLSMLQVRDGRYRSASKQFTYIKSPLEKLKKQTNRDVIQFRGELMDKTSIIYTGIYVNKIESFDEKNYNFITEFLLWFKWTGNSGKKSFAGEISKKDNFFELINGEILEQELTDYDYDAQNDEKYLCHRIRAKFKQNDLNFSKYPFDSHILKIRVRHKNLPSNKLRFVIDAPDMNLKLAEEERYVMLGNWKNESQINFVEYIKRTKSFKYIGRDKPQRIVEENAVYNFHLTFKRNFFPYLIKFLLPLVIIITMAFLVFFIHSKEFESNIEIGVSALFSAIAFHISQRETLPKIGYLVTADLFFVFTYFLILLTIVESVIANIFYHKNKMNLAKQTDQFSLFLFPLFLIIIIFFIITRT